MDAIITDQAPDGISRHGGSHGGADVQLPLLQGTVLHDCMSVWSIAVGHVGSHLVYRCVRRKSR